MDKITVTCAWCGKHLGTKDGKGQSGISHGICATCRDKMLKPSKIIEVYRKESELEVDKIIMDFDSLKEFIRLQKMTGRVCVYKSDTPQDQDFWIEPI